MHSCDQCGTTFTRKNNLTRHKADRCKGKSTPIQHVTPVIGQKRISAIQPLQSQSPKNPRIEALLDAVVNDNRQSVSSKKRPHAKDDFGFDSMTEAQKAAEIANESSSKDDFVFGFNSTAEAQEAARQGNKKKRPRHKDDDFVFGFNNMTRGGKSSRKSE